MRIGLLTCGRLPQLTEADQRLIPLLEQHGLIAEAVIWDNPKVDWTNFDYLIFRNTWDYYEKESAFNSWLQTLNQLGVKTLNALSVIEKNKHKFYLRDIENKGIEIIPTRFVTSSDYCSVAELVPADWQKIVVKPAFSAGSYLTKVFDSDQCQELENEYRLILAGRDLLLQKYMPEIETLGETSFVFFNKKFSHAITKKPLRGDFRIQKQFGGIYEAYTPSAELLKQAQRIIDLFEDPLLYARVDGICVNDKLLLMEVECIEPDLYFDYHEGTAERFVAEILNLIK